MFLGCGNVVHMYGANRLHDPLLGILMTVLDEEEARRVQHVRWVTHTRLMQTTPVNPMLGPLTERAP